VSKIQLVICTFLLYSGSQPSLFGPWLLTVTPSTVTLLHLIGCITQKGALVNVTPCIRTFSQSNGSKNVGRKWWPSPKIRSSTGVAFSFIFRSLGRLTESR